MPTQPIRLTRANALTLTRALLAPVLVLAILGGAWWLATAAFLVAVATDMADGRVARRYGEVSEYGALLDHGTDAAFVACGVAALAATGWLPLPLAPMIALAFAQYAIDSRLMGQRELRASALGRWNGIAYYVAVAVPVVREALGSDWPDTALVSGFGWALVVTTGLSMLDRLRASVRAE